MKTENTIFLLTCFLIQVHTKSHQSQEGVTFRCHNDEFVYHQYIPEDEFCNNNMYCPDGEDEHLGCKRDKDHFCGEKKFWCDNQCKHNITVRCNTINDCQDGTDEENCGDEINVKNCTNEDQFLCEDGLRCLRLDYTCDGECNCFDCSDENENCLKTDHDLMAKCPHSYFETLNGPECFCDSNKTGYSKLCQDIKSCKGSFHSCQQRCLQFRLKTQCLCYDGYHPVNGTSGALCFTKENISIFYTDGYSIKMLNKNSMMTSTISSQLANCTLLSAANGYIYYNTFSRDKGSIFKKSLNKDEKPECLIETDFVITSIAVDYITNNVYFTSNGSLSVCTSSGSICTQLKCCDIFSVTLAPKNGLMFYIKHKVVPEFHIKGSLLMKSNMDGSGEDVLDATAYTGIIFFYVEVDEPESSIYIFEKHGEGAKFSEKKFSSGFGHFHATGWRSRSSTTSSSDIQRVSAFDKMAFFTKSSDNNSFYFQSVSAMFEHGWPHRFIEHISENTISNITDMFAYAPTQLYDQNPCNNDESSCSGLCLLKPSENKTSSGLGLSHSCFSDTNRSIPSMIPWVLLGILMLIILATSASTYLGSTTYFNITSHGHIITSNK